MILIIAYQILPLIIGFVEQSVEEKMKEGVASWGVEGDIKEEVEFEVVEDLVEGVEFEEENKF